MKMYKNYSVLTLGALALAFSANAAAQSNVAVYGLIDANVSVFNHADANGNTVYKLNSGGMNTSRWGLRGTEDLGGGLKALFQLEGGILLDTGSADGDVFGRQANVGLQGEFGRVIAGRSFSTTYDFLINFDPMGYAPQYSWATSAGATGSRKDGMLTGVSNLIKYQYDGQGYKIGASYGFGETAGNTSAAAKYILAGSVFDGPWAVVASYERNNAALATNGQYDQSTAWHLAGKYDFSGVIAYAGLRSFKKSMASGAAEQQSTTYWLGASYVPAPNWTLTAAYYYQDIKNMAPSKDADPGMLSLRAKYALSKRTDIYISAAQAKAKNNLAVGVSRDDPGFGSSQSSATVGMQHRF